MFTFRLSAFLAILSAAACLENSVASSVTISGGGTNGEVVLITIHEDIELRSLPGQSFGGYFFGFRIDGVISTSGTSESMWGANWYDLPNTAEVDALYRSSTVDLSGMVLPESNVSFEFNGDEITVSFSKYPDEFEIVGGASLTISAGTITVTPEGGNIVLLNPGGTYELTAASFFSFSEQYPALDIQNAIVVPEPRLAVFLATAACVVLVRRRR